MNQFTPHNPLFQHSNTDPKSGKDEWAREQIKLISTQLQALIEDVKTLSGQMANLLDALADEESTDTANSEGTQKQL